MNPYCKNLANQPVTNVKHLNQSQMLCTLSLKPVLNKNINTFGRFNKFITNPHPYA
jgi:hypothetical protein